MARPLFSLNRKQAYREIKQDLQLYRFVSIKRLNDETLPWMHHEQLYCGGMRVVIVIAQASYQEFFIHQVNDPQDCRFFSILQMSVMYEVSYVTGFLKSNGERCDISAAALISALLDAIPDDLHKNRTSSPTLNLQALDSMGNIEGSFGTLPTVPCTTSLQLR